MLNRRLLIAQVGAEPPGGGIVQDGLVFRLDGKNRGGTVGVWEDVINAGKFELVDANELSNGVEFNGETSYAEVKGGASWDVTPDKVTIQAAYNIPISSRKDWILYSPAARPDKPATISRYINQYIFTGGSGKAYLAGDDIGDNTISMSMDHAYRNKKSLPQNGTNNYLGNGGGPWLARRRVSSPPYFMGAIFEVRIYNRILTDEEVLQNQQYDIDTYFGGVVPE